MDKKYLQHNILEEKYNSSAWKEVLIKVFGATKIHQQPIPIPLPANDIADKAVEIGSFYTQDERLIGIYEITLKEESRTKIALNKVGLRNLLRNVYKYDVDGALIVFIQEEKWRFSYVSEIKTETGKKETEPKRYTYLFGKGETSRTAAERFSKLTGKPFYLNDLYDAFSVEKLNDEFFKTYKEFHERFWQYLNNQQDYREILINKKENEIERQEKPIRDFVKKLLGRIVFLHFLQKKGWMGCPLLSTAEENETIWKDGKTNFMQVLYDSFPESVHFHSKCLKTLFFKTLNTKRDNNIFSIKLPVEAGRDNIFTRVPYLNGGLFDKDISAEVDFDFPTDYFKSLFGFFEQFNFTIDENDPYDNEVGIDPEMLGHIFENLLEENREKGTFYTPKEIVQFMCRQSLLQYLRTHLPECIEDDSAATKALEQFLVSNYIEDRKNKKNFIVRSAKRIENLLDQVKICDPAIGSGAFPMGMLQQIFNARLALDLTLDRASIKKDIIQKNIYGVDIENGAVDISRLRFWLSLVVDEDMPQPLPNLDYKIMQGDSLFEKFESIDLKFEAKRYEVKLVKEVDLFGKPVNPQITINEYLQSKADVKEFDLTELEDKYFNSNSPEEKLEIKRKIDAFEKEFIGQQINKRQKELETLIRGKKDSVEKKKQKELEEHLKEKEELKQASSFLHQMTPTNKPYFLWHLYFMDVFKQGGFDIIIANPPYIRQELLKDIKYKLQEEYEVYNSVSDVYTYFYELSYKLLKEEGVSTFITSNNWIRAGYGKKLRQFFKEKTEMISIVDFDDEQMFQNAIVATNILTIKKVLPSKKRLIRYYKKLPTLGGIPIIIEQDDLEIESFSFQDEKTEKLKNKIRNGWKLLKHWDVEINRGITSGFNDAFYLTKSQRDELVAVNPKYEKIIKPILRGRDIKRFAVTRENTYLLFIPWHFPLHNDASIKGSSILAEIEFQKEYTEIYQHLLKYKSQLSSRNTAETNIRYEWYALQRCAATFYKDFEKEKIVWLVLSDKAVFAIDTEGNFTNDSAFIMVGPHLKYLCSILNSKISEWYFDKIASSSGMGTNMWKKYKIQQLPVPELKNEEVINKLVDKIVSVKKKGLETSTWENKIDALVFHLYGLTEEEALQILDSFSELSIKDKNQIHNEYRNIQHKHFNPEL